MLAQHVCPYSISMLCCHFCLIELISHCLVEIGFGLIILIYLILLESDNYFDFTLHLIFECILQMQSAYRGGRRGRRPFRGGTLGHAGHAHNCSQHTPSNGAASAIPNSVLDPNGAAAAMLPAASVPGHATLPAQVPAAPLRPPPRMAWCELCRVDCNRPEILEQHKNGKRHKKNLQVREELQKRNGVITGQQSVQVPNLGSEIVQLVKVEGSEEKQHQQMVPSLAATTDNKKEIEQQQDIVNKPEASTTGPAEAKRNLRNPSEARGRGLKRKMRGGRGGKYVKRNEGSRRPSEPPKPKGGIPFMCELCNVKCETQVVFNCHLAGKKHIANMKRFHGHRALYGEAGVQALYPPNISAPPPPLVPQIQQGVTDPQVVLAQLLTYVLSQAQVPGLAGPQVSLPIATLESAQAPLSSSGNQYQHEFPQGLLATSEVRNGLGVMAEAETWQQHTAAKSEALPSAGDRGANSQGSESEKNEVSQQQSFSAKTEFPTTFKMESGDLDTEIPPMDDPIATTSMSKRDSTTASLDPVDESESNNNLEQPEDPEEDPEENEQNEAA
ncbi:hypothetical protein V6Z12_A07G169600 [Gossypium hirsutum]|uniref:Uncharacterized protein LOC107952765 isoform X2 n=1 Tax=Gossypium hirsutum TaxID=3635 RepID=A0A1U8NWT8_GOSHI|nr:uncharacterized protein LOC107952765 isoform X2 [Gossypium hirsutum]XP_040972887.1 uncharacterized protein LOC107952765 isoform X2 [Gossypium hirsutum]